jgi:D-alanyl-lipoteichoic acid acyltransferase DltB (MBOAT superfamily)
VRYRNHFLLLASYFFYFSYDPRFVPLLFLTSAVDFWCAKKIRQGEHKRAFLLISLFSNLGVLVAFKYSAFFYNGAMHLLGTEEKLIAGFLIPAGLSFYTFQSLSYVIDAHRNKPSAGESFTDFLLYVSFFPHMVAGPIVRYESLMPQLLTGRYFKDIKWGIFVRLCIWGYFKKMVIADNLDLLVSPVFSNVTEYNGAELLVAGFLFTVQVYCDFSGYSDIATGVARLFGIELTLNWRRPLLSRSLHEFWQRNHISITTWFRDYLYISLGGNRVSANRKLFNIFLVFLISGFWHGANLTFIIWGAMHGLLYLAEILFMRKFPAVRSPVLIGNLYLMAFHVFSLIAFRAENLTDLSFIYRQICEFTSYSQGIDSLTSLLPKIHLSIILMSVIILFLKELNEEYALLNRWSRVYAVARPATYILLVIAVFLFGNFNANTFIYFNF